MNGTRIRLATPADMTALLDLQRADTNALGHLTTAAVAAYVDGGMCHVAQHRGRVIAYILGRKRYAYATDTRPVTQLVVHRDYRRHGTATRLVNAIATEARQGRQSMLQCWTRADLSANELWRNLGWTPIAIRRPTTQRRKPLILWRLDITEDGTAPLGRRPPRAGHHGQRIANLQWLPRHAATAQRRSTNATAPPT